MNRRLIRPIIHLLVIAQLLLSAPVSQAFAGVGGHGTGDMPCASSMPMADVGKHCPCCPDGAMDSAACLSACTASVGAIPVISIPQRVNAVFAMHSVPRVVQARFFDPPLTPPPIV